MRYLIFSSILFTTQLSIASELVHNYICWSYLINGFKNKNEVMILSVSEQHSNGDLLNEFWDKDLIGGRLNTSYQSKGPFKYLKYGTLIVEEILTKGGRQLDNGSMGGLARFEAVIEGGFTQYKFICKHQEKQDSKQLE